MKLTTVVNLSTFFVTASAIGYAVFGIALSERHDVQAVYDRLHEIRNGRETLTNDTLAFVQSQSRDQDQLARSCERLNLQVTELVTSIDHLPVDQQRLTIAAQKAVDAAESTASRVDRIRAQNAVLTNVESTLPRLIESLIKLLPANSGHVSELADFANTFPVVARSQHEQAEQLVLTAKSNLERTLAQHSDTEIRSRLELAIAQVERVLAYRKFQQTELQLLLDGRESKDFESAMLLAKESVQQFSAHNHGLVRVLTIASITLIAFGCAGVWQFRVQAQRLRQLNDELEDRVKERTRDAAEARRRSEAQLDALDRIQGRVEFDTAGVITHINDNYLATTGYSRYEVVGQHHRMFVFDEESQSDEYTQFWDKLRSGDFSIGEYLRKAKDGSDRWIHATYSPVVNEKGEVEKVVKYATDITKQRLIEEKAQRRIRDLANVILESPNEVFISDAETLQFIEVNHGAIKASGYTANELLQMTPLDLNPDFDEESIAGFLKDLKTGAKQFLDFQSKHRRKNGETYPVQISVHLSTYNERPVYVAFVTDLTDVRELENKLALARKLESV